MPPRCARLVLAPPPPDVQAPVVKAPSVSTRGTPPENEIGGFEDFTFDGPDMTDATHSRKSPRR